MEINDVIKILKSQFEITDLGDMMLYFGIEATRENRMFYLSQKKYIEKILDNYNLKDAKMFQITHVRILLWRYQYYHEK